MVDVVARPNIAESMALSHEVEQFLYREAEMLDSCAYQSGWNYSVRPASISFLPPTNRTRPGSRSVSRPG